MGANKSKRQPDLNETLTSMRMKAKLFMRESQRCQKEKKAHVEKAKKCLQQGNEQGARLFLESANTKESEAMKYMTISNRLDAMSAKVGSNYKTQEVDSFDGSLWITWQESLLSSMMPLTSCHLTSCTTRWTTSRRLTTRWLLRGRWLTRASKIT